MNKADGKLVLVVPPLNLMKRSVPSAVFWRVIPDGLIPETLTTSVNASVSTPLLRLKLNRLSSGSVSSGVTDEACRAAVGKKGMSS